MILGREDVARHPAHVGAELDQGLDEHRGLYGHVQAAHHLGAGQRLGGAVTPAQLHQAGHLVLGQADLLAAPLGQAHIGHFVGLAATLAGGGERIVGRHHGQSSSCISCLAGRGFSKVDREREGYVDRVRESLGDYSVSSTRLGFHARPDARPPAGSGDEQERTARLGIRRQTTVPDGDEAGTLEPTRP